MSYSSMLQVMALSTVVDLPITSLFPNVPHYARSLYHCTVQPRVQPSLEDVRSVTSETQLPIIILWTAYGVSATCDGDGIFIPNHIVPVIQKSALTIPAIPANPKPPIHPFLGPPKPKKTAPAKVDKDRAYDQSSRNRQFQKHWKTTYAWLELDKANGAMFCRPCQKHPQHSDKNGMFVWDNMSYHLDSIKAHSKSAGHRRSVANDTTVEVKTTPAHQMLLTLKKLTVARLKHLFRNCMPLTKRVANTLTSC